MTLDYLEVEITEFCNLNCKSCANCSNIAKHNSFYELNEFKKDLLRLSEIFSKIEKIRLMGGEPFLNPDIVEYAKTVKDIFPDCDLRIVTNGLLIPKISTSSFVELKKLGAFLDISNYPPTHKRKKKITNKLKNSGLGYNFGPRMRFFFKFFLNKPSENGHSSFENCFFSHCHMLSHGKLAPCSFAYCARRLNENFGSEFPENDCFDIYSDLSAEDIICKFSHEHEFCRYCSPALIPVKWQGGTTASKAKLSDWVIDINSPLIKMLSVVQRITVGTAIRARKAIQKR